MSYDYRTPKTAADNAQWNAIADSVSQLQSLVNGSFQQLEKGVRNENLRDSIRSVRAILDKITQLNEVLEALGTIDIASTTPKEKRILENYRDQCFALNMTLARLHHDL